MLLLDTMKNEDEKGGSAEDKVQPSRRSLMDVKLLVEFKVTERGERSRGTSVSGSAYCRAPLTSFQLITS